VAAAAAAEYHLSLQLAAVVVVVAGPAKQPLAAVVVAGPAKQPLPVAVAVAAAQIAFLPLPRSVGHLPLLLPRPWQPWLQQFVP
jgi:hypothetical protein